MPRPERFLLVFAPLTLAAIAATSGPAFAEGRIQMLERLLREYQRQQAVSQQRIEKLERRIGELESSPRAAAPAESRFDDISSRLLELESDRRAAADAVPAWLRTLRISGSADVGYFGGQDNSYLSDSGFKVWDARLFIESELGKDVMLGETKLVRDVGFLFEWNLARLGELENGIGELYIELQGLLDRGWLNVQVGRFQIPFGEAYLRYSQGYKDDPFITKTLGGPWFWDEGVKIYGSDPSGRFGYVASVTDGETPMNHDANENKQLTLKLFTDPWKWLHLSVSALRSGRLGSPDQPALAAIWFGEGFPTAFGLWNGLPNYDHGVAIPDGPFQLENVTALGADAILKYKDLARLWLGYGGVNVDSYGSGVYDRDLSYWIAELVLQGKIVGEQLAPLYLAARADGIGTYDGDRGYMLEPRYGDTLGWNQKAIAAWSLAAGWRLTDRATIKAEYTRYDIDLVRGVTPAMKDAAERVNLFALEMGVHF
jgi:hypothetical protein